MVYIEWCWQRYTSGWPHRRHWSCVKWFHNFRNFPTLHIPTTRVDIGFSTASKLIKLNVCWSKFRLYEEGYQHPDVCLIKEGQFHSVVIQWFWSCVKKGTELGWSWFGIDPLSNCTQRFFAPTMIILFNCWWLSLWPLACQGRIGITRSLVATRIDLRISNWAWSGHSDQRSWPLEGKPCQVHQSWQNTSKFTSIRALIGWETRSLTKEPYLVIFIQRSELHSCFSYLIIVGPVT